MDHDKFLYEKKQILQDGVTTYMWYLINRDKRNGVHFHGRKKHDVGEYFRTPFCNGNQFCFDASGIESHSKTPIYKDHKPIENCFVTGGDCYYDGTSLIATERLGHVDPDNCDAEVWCELEYLYKQWHEEQEND